MLWSARRGGRGQVADKDDICYYTFDMGTFSTSIAVALPYIQITLATLLIIAILLQQRGSSIGGAFGGDNFSATFHKRRGAELFLFRATIVLGILFVISVLLALSSSPF